MHALGTENIHHGLSTERILAALLENAGRRKMHGVAAGRWRSPTSGPHGIITVREDEPLTEDLLEGALEALRHRRLSSGADIKRGIVEAERHNDMTHSCGCKQEKLELDRKMAGLE